MKHFTLEDAYQSKLAEYHKINNTPEESYIIDNLKRVLLNLDNVREIFGKPIYINSGYRCKELNWLVAGNKNSDHLIGCAVDITTDNIEDNKLLYRIIRDNVDFDKLIIEYGYQWLHLSIKENNNRK